MLILRRSYPDSEHFWKVLTDGVYVGTIVYNDKRPEPVWNWTIQVQWPSPGMAKEGMSDTRDEAMVAFRAAWQRYRSWLGDELWQRWVKHMQEISRR